MDISFACDKCGRKLVIDDAGAGITIDCPDCGKPVYVPNSPPASPPKPKDAPARVEAKPLGRVAIAPAAPAPTPAAPTRVLPSRPRSNPLVPSSTPKQRTPVHPSIEAAVHCLVILVGMEFVAFLCLRQSLSLANAILLASMPFIVAPLLCAIYGMCVGHVRHGLLVLAGLSLIIALSCLVAPAVIVGPTQAQIQEIMQQQMQNLQKAFPQPPPHP